MHMKGLIFKRNLGLISEIYDRRRNERWQKMPYIEGNIAKGTTDPRVEFILPK